MKQHEVSGRQMGVWLLAAVSGPLSAAAGAGWAAVALAGLAMLPLTRLSDGGWQYISGRIAIVESVWLSVLAGMMLRHSAVFWPGSRSEWFVPLVLTALVFLTKPVAAPRVGAVVGLCLAALYVPVLIGGAAQAEPRWLRAHAGTWSQTLLIAMLIPALWGLWREEATGMGHALSGTAVVGILFAALVQGILSPGVAVSLPDAFYQASRTVALGILSRIEPVAAVASTLGWYALGALFHSCAVRLAIRGNSKELSARIGSAVFMAAMAVSGASIPGVVSVGACVLLWVITPLWAEKRKFKKDEKRC